MTTGKRRQGPLSPSELRRFDRMYLLYAKGEGPVPVMSEEARAQLSEWQGRRLMRKLRAAAGVSPPPQRVKKGDIVCGPGRTCCV